MSDVELKPWADRERDDKDLLSPAAAPESHAPDAEEAVEQLGRTINVQTVFLGIIAGLLVLYTLYFSRTVVIPLVLACMFNLVLTPVVLALARVRIPAPVGAGLVVFFVLLVLGIGVLTLAQPASRMAAPAALRHRSAERPAGFRSGLQRSN